MKKILIIDACNKCPFYDNEYYSYNEKCTAGDRHVENPRRILEDCPLNDAPDDEKCSI